VAARLLNRFVREEEGFTLLELMIAVQIIAILVLFAVPAYMLVRDSANQATAKTNAKEVAVAAGLYFTKNGSYAGMTVPLLKAWDASLKTTGTYVNNSGAEAVGVTNRVTMDASNYCIYATSGRWYVYQHNPNGAFTATTVASTVCS